MKPFLKQMARMVVPSAARAWWADRRLTALSRDEDFQKAGRDFVRWMIEVADLQPHHRVLEPGCGLGRNALPLIEYLRDGGSYDGFDILQGEIEWATRNISAAHPHFRFQHAHIYNKYYNILDGCPSTEYRFPYEAESFDFVFLGSVFTHMLRADVEHYLDEIARVLKPGGRCFITYYLLNDERRSNGTAARFPQPTAASCTIRSDRNGKSPTMKPKCAPLTRRAA